MAILPSIKASKSRSYYYDFRRDLAGNLSNCIDDIIKRADRMGVSVDRLKLESLVKKYASYSGQPRRTEQSILDRYGYGYYRNGRWSISCADHWRANEVYQTTPYCKLSGALIDPDNLILVCSHCGAQEERTQEYHYLHSPWCSLCTEAYENISELQNESASVKKLINKLKKVIKDENKRLES